MTSFSLAGIHVRDESAARDLISRLEKPAALLAAYRGQPTLVADAPHKFNDATEDDLWCAVQSGETFWEQSQFFENVSPPRSTERSSYTLDDQDADIADSGAALQSHRIGALRAILRDLQTSDLRRLIERAFDPPRNLNALVVEFRQPWLYLEQVNGDDGDAFAWDADGFFHVGRMSRLDQNIGSPRALVFEHLDATNLQRLGESARNYFLPEVRDPSAAARLTALLQEAVAVVRAATDVPVALRSGRSRVGATDLDRYPHLKRPESYAENLRPQEGEYRIPTNGKWPLYRNPKRFGEESELSDVAKAYHTAMFVLEDGGWRAEFGAACGEDLTRSETLALYIGSSTAVLTRDNSAFRVTSSGLKLLGAFDYPICNRPAQTLAQYGSSATA